MRKVQVVGCGDAKCLLTAREVRLAARELGLAVEVEKVDRPDAIAAFGLIRTPAVAIDGTIVHAGSIPSRDTIAAWLRAVH